MVTDLGILCLKMFASFNVVPGALFHCGPRFLGVRESTRERRALTESSREVWKARSVSSFVCVAAAGSAVVFDVER